jgi:hypothetical protein
MILEHDIELKKSFARWGYDDFEEVFLDELQENFYRIPLQNFCHEGGWPDDDSLQLKVVSFNKKTKDTFVVNVECWFTELVPSSCADISTPRDRSGLFEVVLDLHTERAFVPEDKDS